MFRTVSRIEFNGLELEYNGLEIKKITTQTREYEKNGKISSCIRKPGRGERGRRFLGWVGLSLKSKNHPTVVLYIFFLLLFSAFLNQEFTSPCCSLS